MTIYNKVIKFMLDELTKTADSEALISTVVMIYVFIDTLTALAMPITKSPNGRNDFITWINTYLKTSPEQAYQYDGKDVYGARCGLLHAFSSDSNYSEEQKCKRYVYHTRPNHIPDDKGALVLISVNRLFRDFADALETFFIAALKDKELKSRIDNRIKTVFIQFDLDKN